jgi:alkanesulfonate monooxygenase SsuD/methylene tetrahydromethanopterin reductase-like flavin-dependent oxidoreductase (luciferase family)
VKLGLLTLAELPPERLVATVRMAETEGYAYFWHSDEKFYRDPWVGLTLTALESRSIRLGTGVTEPYARHPALLAMAIASLDEVSGGRAILGIGAGWFEREHEAFGFHFGTGFGERLDRLGEALPLIRRLLDGERVTHAGPFYRFEDAICAPRPIQERLPILIGGSGPRKTLPLVARYADLWNAYGSPDELAAADGILRAACEDAGRDEAEIERTVNVNVVIRRDRAGAERAWSAWAAVHRPQDGEERLDAAGTVEQVAASLARFRDVGFAHPVLVFRTPFDLETMDRLPDLRAALLD